MKDYGELVNDVDPETSTKLNQWLNYFLNDKCSKEILQEQFFRAVVRGEDIPFPGQPIMVFKS